MSDIALNRYGELAAGARYYEAVARQARKYRTNETVGHWIGYSNEDRDRFVRYNVSEAKELRRQADEELRRMNP
jgi:hypothetical protein